MKKLCLIFLVLSCILCLGGCGGSDEDSEGSYSLYYVNKSGTELVTESYEPEADGTEELIEEFIEALETGLSADTLKTIPDNVQITGYYLEDENLHIIFSDEYSTVDGISEIICRASLVLTLTQIDGVSGVSFQVGETPLADADGNAIGVMSASDFVDNMGTTKNEEELTTFTLYFANETGDALIPYSYEDTYSTDTSVEKYIVEQLIKGPSEEGYYRTISDQVELISVVTNDGICYVNFGGNFLTETTNVQDDIVIYSIVNSITEVGSVNSVQISVNGETSVSYHNNISLETSFTRNMEYVTDNTTEDENESE